MADISIEKRARKLPAIMRNAAKHCCGSQSEAFKILASLSSCYAYYFWIEWMKSC